MKLFKIINAFKALETLSENVELSKKEQWELYKLRKQLRSHIEFEQEREEAVKEKYRPNANENGELTSTDAVKYLEEIQDLVNMDVEVEDFTKPQIKFAKGISCKITDPLEDFIEFVQPD